jgi:hypothetical protein
MDPPSVQFDEEPHLEAPQPHGVDGEQVAGDDPGGLLPKNARHVVAGRPSRGRIDPMTSQRCADRGAETCTPSRWSSPWMR